MKTANNESDRNAMLARHGITTKEFNSTGLEWSLLDEISAHHQSRMEALQRDGNYHAEELQQVAAVHSIRVRIKDPEGLAAKIIRKKLDDPKLHFDVESYQKLVTDLIGLRALYIFKYEWKPIHEWVKGNWELHEQAKAYVRDGDSSKLRAAFKASKCKVLVHPFGYRSNHYLIRFKRPKNNTYIAELQTRSIFEEGWSEIDHRVRYPRHSDDTLLKDCLAIFNRLSGMSDEMGTFIKLLSEHSKDQAERMNARDWEIAEKEVKLNNVISKLNITEKEKAQLQKEIKELRMSSGPLEQHSIFPHYLIDAFDLSNISSSPYLSSSGLPYAGRQKICNMCGRAFSDSPNSTQAFSISSRCPQCDAKRLCTLCGKTYMQTRSSAQTVAVTHCPDCRNRTSIG